MAALFGAAGEATLPTYKTAAAVLERKKGSGLALIGWTVARTILIAPPLMLWGIPAWQAFAGAATASVLISIFTVLRIFNGAVVGLGRPSSGMNRRRLSPGRSRR